VGDVLLQQTNDGGDITFVNRAISLTDGFEVAAYLSLFGGNEDDDGSPSSVLGWWGNLIESEDRFKLISRTQYLLRSIPITVPNVLRLQRAAEADLVWFVTSAIASRVTVSVTVVGLNRVQFAVTIVAVGGGHTFNFTENWKAAV